MQKSLDKKSKSGVMNDKNIKKYNKEKIISNVLISLESGYAPPDSGGHELPGLEKLPTAEKMLFAARTATSFRAPSRGRRSALAGASIAAIILILILAPYVRQEKRSVASAGRSEKRHAESASLLCENSHKNPECVMSIL